MKKDKKKKKKVAGVGLKREYEMSEELAAVVGGKPKTRPRVVKRLWAYIKKYKLQDKKNRRVINPDKKLSKVGGKKPIDMFAMQKTLSDHLS